MQAVAKKVKYRFKEIASEIKTEKSRLQSYVYISRTRYALFII